MIAKLLRLFPQLTVGVSLLLNSSQAARWEPITDEEHALTRSEIDPNAGAEVLYKFIEMDNESPDNSYRKYALRFKIFDERGAESVRQFRMTYHVESSRLGQHSARIVRADGTVDEIDKSEFYNQKLEDSGANSFRAKVFTFPELNPGDIVDVQYRIDLLEGYYSPELFVDFQERWPLRRAEIRVRPATWVTGFNYVKWMTSKCNAEGMKRRGDGFYELNVEGFPASVDEPNSPPENQTKAWLLFYLAADGKSGDAYWKSQGTKLYREMERDTKAGSEVKSTLKRILKGISDDEEKLKAIYRYCVSEIVNSYHGEPGQLTPEDRDKLDSGMVAEKVLSQGFGTPKNINTVFCALAREAGIDARVAALSNRTDYQFSKVLTSIDTTMNGRCIAIRDGEGWRYFDPGGKYLPFGQLDWDEQGVVALVADKKKVQIHPVDFGKPKDSVQKSTAKFELSEKGTLWGDVAFEFAGHFDVAMKRTIDGKSSQGRIDTVKEVLSDQWPGASFSEIEISNATSPFDPLKINCNVSIVNYADVVGDRLFFQVNAFQKSAKPEFPESTRSADLFFRFPKTEIDKVEIKLPDGYELEAASAPRPFSYDRVFEYGPKLGLKKSTNTLIYSRDFMFAGTIFPVKHYEVIKGFFDQKHVQDQHSLTIKKKPDSDSAS